MNDRYNVSKLLEVYIVREWVRLYMSNDYRVVVNAVNPELRHSELSREVGLPMTIFKEMRGRARGGRSTESSCGTARLRRRLSWS
jgi:hypothetical protein